jgi:hypothetical protein
MYARLDRGKELQRIALKKVETAIERVMPGLDKTR